MPTPISSCRVCRGTKLQVVIDLGQQALTGRFPRSPSEQITTGPLQVAQCEAKSGCGLVQLRHSYDLNEMYGESYGYRSGLNPSMVAHLNAKVQAILGRGVLYPGDLVIDIGANDGTTLNAYPQGTYQLVGIDPSCAKFGQYYKDGITKLPTFFNAETFTKAFPNRKAKVITSFSMFYDLENPVQFSRDVAVSLDPKGIWVCEQSYLPAMLKANSFDTVCHEHLEYYSLRQFIDILGRAELEVLDVDFNDVNGGSFSVTSAKWGSGLPKNEAKISQILESEQSLGLDSGKAFADFNARVAREKDRLIEFLHAQKAAGKRVCGLGASTKGNVLLQNYRVTPDLLESVAEVNPDKYGCFTPGTHIPIVAQDELLATNPDFLLVLPWHFRDFFLNSPRLKGRTLVFPLPEFEIVRTKG